MTDANLPPDEPADAETTKEEAEAISDYIRHTDSGTGVSQAPHWKPTVSGPEDEG